MRMKTKNKLIGTGIFNLKDYCQDCKSLTNVDINGFCEDCYIDDIEKEMARCLK